MAKDDTRTCPECGAKLAPSILLCDCGYHFQTRRVLERAEAAPVSDATAASHVAALRVDGDGPPPRIWLERAAVVLQILAIVGVAATVIWSGMLLTALVKAEPPTDSAHPADGSALVTLVLVILGGAVHFILLRGASEAATALREIERHAFVLRAASRRT